MPAPALTPTDVSSLTDHEVIAGGLRDQVAVNFYAAQRLERLDEFHRRCEADIKARKAAAPHVQFVLTALQETVMEASGVWGMSESQLRSDLGTVRTLKKHGPEIWELFRTGALDPYKASLIADAVKLALGQREDLVPRFAARMTRWLQNSVRRLDDGGSDGGEDVGGDRPGWGLVDKTVKQLRNKLNYEVTKLKPRDADQRFKSSYEQRSARAVLDENGMGTLTLHNGVHDVKLADYRLTAVAKAMRAQGDSRTLEQLRTDVAMDLLTGRAVVDPSIGELEEIGETATPDDGVPPGTGVIRRLPTLKYTRPIINITVPLQTVMGFSDHPGTMSGGTMLPASLCRMIANQPDSTWYRMLTDEQSQFVELSTKSYQPSEPMWRSMVARDGTCFLPVCDVPASEAEADHRKPWPHGKTTLSNIGPGCHRHHMGKHSPGFRLETNDDGTVTLHTRAGFAHTSEPVEQPVVKTWPEDELFEIQPTATEILDAIRLLRAERKGVLVGLAERLDEDEMWLLRNAS